MKAYRVILKSIVSVWPWVLLTVILTTLPYWFALRLTPAGTQFLGALINPEDLSVYLAAIRQGAEGAWLFKFPFTAETIAPKLNYPFYMALGRFMNLFPADALWLFHASRTAAGLALLLTTAVWLDFLRLGRAKRDAFILIFLSGGWGWLFLNLGWILPDIHVAEWTPFLSIFHAPHFSLGLLAEILVIAALLAAYRSTSGNFVWPIITAVIGAVSLSLLYPYRIVPLGGVIVLYLAAEAGRNWREHPTLVATGLLPLLALGGMGLYYALSAGTDLYWGTTFVTQNIIASPRPFEAFMGWGIPGLLALLAGGAAVKNWSRLPDAIRLCFIWFGVGVGCLYLPVSFQGAFRWLSTCRWPLSPPGACTTCCRPKLPIGKKVILCAS